MKKIILTFSLLMLCIAVNAQETYGIDLLKGPNIGTQNIVIDSVIDNRMLNESFGVTAKGLSNRRVPIIVMNYMGGIQKYIKSILPDTSKRVHLTMVVNHIWMYETTGALMEEGVCDLDATFCIKDANNNLMAVQDFSDEVKEKRFDASATHRERLISILHNAMLFADKINFKEAKGVPFVISERNPAKCISYIENPKIGFFKTFNDFYNNNPIEVANVILKPTLGGDNKLYKLQCESCPFKINKFYAYSDGINLYINQATYTFTFTSTYAKVIQKGRYMLVDVEYIDPMVSAATAGFGLVGAVIAVSSIQRGVLVDIENGKIIPLFTKNLKQLLSKYPDLEQRYSKVKEHTFEINCAFIEALNKREREAVLGK